MQRVSTRRLVTSGILIALAFILSLIKISPSFLYGGAVTLFSMVPVTVLAYMYGVRWGILCGLVFGVLQALLGAAMSQAFAGLSPLYTVLMAFLDYLVAFGVLGLGGVFRGKLKNPAVSLVLGTLLATFLRYLTHFFSGYLLWSEYAEWFFGEMFQNRFSDFVLSHTSGCGMVAVYSAVYNGLYMVPEIILSCIGTAVLMTVPAVRARLAGK